MTNRPKYLRCACCGDDAGLWHQWHNQDAGTGLCAGCADWILEREQKKPVEYRTDLIRTYGLPGVHREPGPRFEAKHRTNRDAKSAWRRIWRRARIDYRLAVINRAEIWALCGDDSAALGFGSLHFDVAPDRISLRTLQPTRNNA